MILAAGDSSRMGVPKALLPLGDSGESFLARLVGVYRLAGIETVAVVVGPSVPAVAAAAKALASPVVVAVNSFPARGQLSSLIVGLDALEDSLPGRLDAALVTPVDMPLVAVETVALLAEKWRSTRAPVIRPERDGRHGHPVIFDKAVFEELRRSDLSLGARSVVHARATSLVDVRVEDEGAFIDIDTRGDYERYVGNWPV